VSVSEVAIPRSVVKLYSRYGYTAFAVIAFVILAVLNVVLDPSLVTASGFISTWATAAPLVLLAIAVTPSLLSGNGGIDLSLGPFAGFCTVLIGTFLNVGMFGQAYFVVPVIIALGVVLGLVNGALVSVMRLQPIMATLGTYLIFTGLAEFYSPGTGGTVPAWLTNIGASVTDLAIVVVVIVAWLLMKRTNFFSQLMAVGQDDRAAYTSGISVGGIRIMAYVIGGFIAGVAGMAMTALISGASSSIGPSYTLTSIAAAALGGVSLAGGRGGILGSVIGALDIFLIENVLTLTNIPVFADNVAYGLILVVAVVVNGVTGGQGVSVIVNKMFSGKKR
jgi:ribose transport system permease protein